MGSLVSSMNSFFFNTRLIRITEILMPYAIIKFIDYFINIVNSFLLQHCVSSVGVMNSLQILQEPKLPCYVSTI